MSITATYVSATSFTAATDLTANFAPGRALLLDCGVDGVKYGYVSYSSYSSPDTTVYLDSTDSQALTVNLADVDFSIVKYQGVGGNIPLELLWMTRGLQTVAVTYKDADEVTLRPGVVHINDGTTEALYQCPGFDKQLTSLGASTWYYIYAKAPANGRVLSASEIEYSTTVPTVVSAKRGYYHGTNAGWRCIGFVLTKSDSAIHPFTLAGRTYTWGDCGVTGLSASDNSGNLNLDQTVTLAVPFGGLSASIYIILTWYSTHSSLISITDLNSSTSLAIGWVNSSENKYESLSYAIRTDGSKQVKVSADTRATLRNLRTLAFGMPVEIVS